jgi:hypothetical protein
MIETIAHENEIIALIISHRFSEPGIHFVTPEDFSQQLAYMRHPAGKVIVPHTHNEVRRDVHQTQEALFVRRGKIRVDFYDRSQTYLDSRLLATGDVILLASGGHGFEFLEESEVIEVKTGPYLGVEDKIRFDGITDAQINVR